MSWDNNPYYNCDKPDCPLSIVAEIGKDPDWDFDMIVVWRHNATGKLFYAQDSGCSCPSPFEDFHFTDPSDTNLTELAPHGFDAFEKEVRDWRDRLHDDAPSHEAVATFLTTVRDALPQPAC